MNLEVCSSTFIIIAIFAASSEARTPVIYSIRNFELYPRKYNQLLALVGFIAGDIFGQLFPAEIFTIARYYFAMTSGIASMTPDYIQYNPIKEPAVDLQSTNYGHGLLPLVGRVIGIVFGGVLAHIKPVDSIIVPGYFRLSEVQNRKIALMAS